MNIHHLTEGWRIFKRSLRVKKHGVRKFPGNAEEICKQVVESCWNGRNFQVSSGHFSCFYIRDFGWTVDSLLKLGHKHRVWKTLNYALSVYSKDRLTTTITPYNRCVDVFRYSPDSLVYLIRSLRVAKAYDLVEHYKKFLIKEINKFEKKVIDPKTSMVRINVNFSSMKDQAKRSSSTYNNAMAALLSSELDKLKFYNPLSKYTIKKNLKKHLWNGKYFYDDMTKHEAVTGDSNLIPFIWGVFTDEKMIKSAIKEMQRVGLESPFPLKYSSKRYKEHKMDYAGIFSDGYEHDSIWMHMGPWYVKLLQKYDKKKAKEHIDKYTKLIEKHKNFLEIYKSDGTPFTSPFYYSDEGMSWAANYLTLI